MKVTPANQLCMVSIDVEEDLGTGDVRQFRGVENLPPVLEVLQRYGIRATLFVTGEVLETHPESVKSWSQRHEIGCHGFSHVPLTSLSPARFEADLARFIHLYADVLSGRPAGFRAVRHTIGTGDLEIVQNQGFAYDSSIMPRYPFFRSYPGYQGKAPRQPYFPHCDNCRLPGDLSILEIPVSPLAFGVPLSGTWLRTLGFGAYRLLLMARRFPFVSLSFHSWDGIVFRGPHARNSGPKFLGLLDRLLALLGSHYTFACGEQIFSAYTRHE